MKEQPEYRLQKAVCAYLKLQYPHVNFMSDTVASVKLTAIQGVRNKAIQKDGFKTPDLIILKHNNGYAGLFIELKIESPFYKGQYERLKKNAHIEQQSRDLMRLNIEGYFACFGWEFNQIKAIIDYYMQPVVNDVPNIEPHTEYFYEFFDK
jgi:hypothetical protein